VIAALGTPAALAANLVSPCRANAGMALISAVPSVAASAISVGLASK
jgi:hypothetical protein